MPSGEKATLSTSLSSSVRGLFHTRSNVSMRYRKMPALPATARCSPSAEMVTFRIRPVPSTRLARKGVGWGKIVAWGNTVAWGEGNTCPSSGDLQAVSAQPTSVVVTSIIRKTHHECEFSFLLLKIDVCLLCILYLLTNGRRICYTVCNTYLTWWDWALIPTLFHNPPVVSWCGTIA